MAKPQQLKRPELIEQVAELRAEVAALTAQVSELESKLRYNTLSVADLSSAVRLFETKVKDIEPNLNLVTKSAIIAYMRDKGMIEE